MNCADFERGLARLLVGEEEPGARKAALTKLSSHAEGCPDCRGMNELLELLAAEPAARDLAAPPPEPYWETFERGLRDKLAQAGPRPARGWRAWTPAAAAFLLAGLALWLVFSSGEDAMRNAGRAPGGEDEIPETLEILLRAAEPGEAMAGLDFLSGLAGLPEAAPGAAPAEPGPDGPSVPAGPFYPDPEAMDAEARRALLDWLREREGRDRGVES